MDTKDEIQAKYLVLHYALGSRSDAVDKDVFDHQHAEVWRHCNLDLHARKSELENQTLLTSQQEHELADLQFMFPTLLPLPPQPHFITPTYPILDLSSLDHRVTNIEYFLRSLYP